MQSIFLQCKDHYLAHVIRLEITKNCSFWSDVFEKVFSKTICEITIDKDVQKKVIVVNFL